MTVARSHLATAETLEYDEKSVNKGLAKEGMGAILDAAKAALEGVDKWTAEAIDAALEPLPEQMDLKKRVVFQAVRVAVCGNMVSPPARATTMALVAATTVWRVSTRSHDGAVVDAQMHVSKPPVPTCGRRASCSGRRMG